MSHIASRIRHLVSQNHLKEALSSTDKWFKNNLKYYCDDLRFISLRNALLLISSNYSNLTQELQSGVITNEQASVKRSQVVKNYLEFADSLEKLIAETTNNNTTINEKVDLEIILKRDFNAPLSNFLPEILSWFSKLLIVDIDDLSIVSFRAQEFHVIVNVPVEIVGKLFQLYRFEALEFLNIDKIRIKKEAEGEFKTEHKLIKENRLIRNGSNGILYIDIAANDYNFGLTESDSNLEPTRFFVPGIEGDLIAFKVSGNAMYPILIDSDIVICELLDSLDELIDLEIYVIVTNDMIWVKRIRKIASYNNQLIQLVLIPENSIEFMPFLIEINEIRKVLKITKVIGRLNEFGT